MLSSSNIKQWLKKSGHDRDWLAAECRVAKKTVDGWLSEGRTIPGPALRIIEMLIATDQDPTKITGLDLDLVLRLDQARKIAGFEDLETFVVSALEAKADELIDGE